MPSRVDQDDEFEVVGVKEFHIAKALIEGHQEQRDNMDSNGHDMEFESKSILFLIESPCINIFSLAAERTFHTRHAVSALETIEIIIIQSIVVELGLHVL